jgi:hypothetical protein
MDSVDASAEYEPEISYGHNVIESDLDADIPVEMKESSSYGYCPYRYRHQNP